MSHLLRRRNAVQLTIAARSSGRNSCCLLKFICVYSNLTWYLLNGFFHPSVKSSAPTPTPSLSFKSTRRVPAPHPHPHRLHHFRFILPLSITATTFTTFFTSFFFLFFTLLAIFLLFAFLFRAFIVFSVLFFYFCFSDCVCNATVGSQSFVTHMRSILFYSLLFSSFIFIHFTRGDLVITSRDRAFLSDLFWPTLKWGWYLSVISLLHWSYSRSFTPFLPRSALVTV